MTTPSDLLTPPPITAATRREFLALLGATGLVSACGTAPGGPGPAGATRPFAHAAGVTEVPPTSCS